jgi:stage V sporulation protein B
MAADFLANRYLNEPRAYLSLIVIAPAALILSITAAFRGYFQGLQEMIPRAVSDIIEQFARVGAILVLAAFLIGHGIEYGSAGAALGVVVGSTMALAYLIVAYLLRRHRLRRISPRNQPLIRKALAPSYDGLQP